MADGQDSGFVYIDDILVASKDKEEHEWRLRLVLDCLRECSMVLNGKKCVMGVSKMDYLGHHISASGILPMPQCVAAIKEHPQPTTARGLQTYLGMVNFYRRFLPAAANVLRPLTEALKGAPKGKISWSADMERSFAQSKAAMLNAAELAHPSPGADLSLTTDASDTHVGAVLTQHLPGVVDRPLAFFSAKLNKAQAKYSAFDRELLACCLAVKHFRWMLEGRSFCIYTDHKPLCFALHRVSDSCSARQQRHLALLAEFTSDIRHVPGRENRVADALSRPAAVVAPSSVTVPWEELADAQAVCEETARLAASSALRVERVLCGGAAVLVDWSTGVPRPLVPPSFQRRVFLAVHELAHPGIRATQRLIAGRFVWRGCAADVAKWCRECQQCGRSKVTVQEKTAVKPITVPSARFWHVHVDIVGPLPVAASGASYLLTIIDRCTRWPEAVPLRGISAQECADAFLAGWVARHGVPHTITTDRGTQFTGAVWACLCGTLKMRHITTTAFHPQSNGMVERLHRQLKDGLRARQAAAQWLEHLPWVLLGIRAAPKEDSGISAAEAVFGGQLALPGQLVDPAGAVSLPLSEAAVDKGLSIPLRARSYAEAAGGRPSVLQGAEYVYVRRGPAGGPFQSAYEGPYKVVSKEEKVVRLEIGGRVETVSADRLKPHRGESPAVAAPPKRGRPPGSGGGGRPSPL